MEEETRYTKQDLETMRAWTLQRKIQVTQTRLIEWLGRYDWNVYVSFSGGKDSTVLVKAFTPGKLNLAPETLEEEVLQNVAIIVSTPKFSVPLDRGLGLAQRFIDKPMQVAQSILISEVLDAVEEYEPRAEVTNVTFEAGETPGLLVPVLEVNIVDNEE